MSYGEGKWSEYRSSQTDEVEGATITVGPAFRGEVYRSCAGGWTGWRARLNDTALPGFPTMAGAKACVDFEIWNQVRQMREGYKALMARKDEWQDGGNGYRSPEYLTVEAAEYHKAQGEGSAGK